MKTFIKLLFLAICLFPSIIGFTSTMDTKSTEEDVQQIIISGTIRGTVRILIAVHENETFTIDWGNETIETKTGETWYILCSYTYPTLETSHSITITGENSNCIFTKLQIFEDYFTNIDVSAAPNLTDLFITENPITNIDLSANTELINLDLSNNKINDIDLSFNTSLTDLNLSNNKLTSLDLSFNTSLINLNLSDNQLSSLDLSSNTELESLYVSRNQISSLDFSNNTALKVCRLENNLLEDLDFTNTIATSIYAEHNNLKTINVSNNPNLYRLYCPFNQLRNIDLSANTILEYLTCNNNQLESLDLSNNSRLRSIACYDNLIEYLDLSTITGLYSISCQNNLLERLDMPNTFNSILCENNSLLLSNLYLISERISYPTSLRIGTQNLYLEILISGNSIDLSGEMKLGESETQTNFVILKDGNPAQAEDYSLDFENETLTFNTEGIYTVTMTNTEIIHNAEYPAEVIATYIVTNSTLRLTDLAVSEETLNPVFSSDNLQYYVRVYSNIEEITISAEASDPNAIITGTGLKTLQYGNNSFEITLTSQDQQESITYYVTLNRAGEYIPSNNADLEDLIVSEGTLTPVFAANTLQYTVNVANDITEVTITATTDDENANVTGDGLKNLTVGTNTFNILVTAENGITTKTYNIIITREDIILSDNANLENLTVSEGTLTPPFTENTLQYTVNVANDITEVTITATTEDQNATVTGDGLKNLTVGANPFDIVVTAEDRNTIKTYNIIITREDIILSDNANLENLTISEGTLTPAFAASTLQYTVSVANDITEVTIAATTADQNATITGDGLKNLTVGANPFDIVVTAEDGNTTKTYNVNITREDVTISNNANLESLTTDVDGVALSPEFNPAVLEYVLSYPVPREQLTITASPEHPNATITGDGLKELLIGEVHSFDIIVTAEDRETTKTYKLKVFNGCIGVDNIRVSVFSIYPNPAIEYIKVDMEKLSGEQSVKIFNAQGIVSYEKILKSGIVHEININNLTDGVYYLQVSDLIKSFNKISK